MTTEGSRTDDASETSAAHCPAELRRRWRTMKGNTTQLLALAFAGIMLLPFSIGGVFGAYLAGGFVAGSETEPLIEWARVAFVYGWIFVVGFGGYRAYAVALRPDNLDGLLTAVSQTGPDQWPPPHRTRALVRVLPHSRQRRIGRVRRRCRLTTHDPRPVAHIVSLYLRPGSQPASSSHSGCETPAFDRGCSAAFERCFSSCSVSGTSR